MIVVTAATGHIGKALVEELLAKKEKVRALGRDPKKLKPLADLGAEALAVDLSDGAAVQRAFQGAAAVFTLIPPNFGAPDLRAYYNQISQIYAGAIAGAGVRYVVNLSSIGAHLPDKTGPIKGLHDHEERLNKLVSVNVLHLRPPFFMENLLANVGLVKSRGVAGGPLMPDLPIPMIATKDIARVAAEKLAKRDFTGHSALELHGQRELSMSEAAAVLGRAIGKPDLHYVQFSYEDASKAMMGMGFSKDVADLFIEMNRAFNEGLVKPTQPRSVASTTPTSIEAFAQTFVSAYNQN